MSVNQPRPVGVYLAFALIATSTSGETSECTYSSSSRNSDQAAIVHCDSNHRFASSKQLYQVSPSMASEKYSSNDWKDELLKDVTTVPKVGVPGIIEVIGDEAEPILLDDNGRAIMAAATYGEGKIVAFSDNGFIKQLQKNKKLDKLNRNIRTWLGIGEGNEKIVFADKIEDAADIAQGSVLVIVGPGNKLKKFVPSILKFIKEGGGLICGVCPCAWLEKHPGKTVDDMVLQEILKEAGLAFTAETCEVAKEISVEQSKDKTEKNCIPEKYSDHSLSKQVEKDEASSSNDWKDELLKDVEAIPKVGVPGIIEVIGEKAEPILLDDNGRAIMAAATYGEGRIVACSHNGFIKQFREGKNKKLDMLNRNIRTWLGTGEGDEKVVPADSIKDASDVTQDSVLLIAGPGNKLKKFVPSILKFIKEGGGLICGVCPQAWLEKHPDKTVDDMVLQEILKDAGLAFTAETCEVVKEISVAQSKDKTGDAHCIPENSLRKSVEPKTSSSDGWKDELLKDVETVPKVGVPGNIVVFGDEAEPILLDDNGRAIMAAAAYGEGKIVAFSHTGYAKQFREGKQEKFHNLNRNIRTWLGIGEGDDVMDADKVKSTADVTPGGVLLIAGPGDKLKKFVPDILKFVKEGGGLICGACPWGWLQKRPRKTVDDMVLQEILTEAGMSFTAGTCSAKKQISAAQSKEKAEISHLGRALKAIDQDPDSVEKYAETVTQNANSIPDKCFEKRLNKPMEKCYEKCVKKHKDCIPKGGKKRVKDNRGRAVVSLTTGFLEKQAKMGKEVKAPGINDFPGDFEEEPQLQCASVIIKSEWKERHSTGYYLPAGKVLKIKATTTGEHIEDWMVRVGAHSDNLSGKKEFKRWPKLSVVKRLEENETRISSPYGGLIYFESPKEAGDLTAAMENVVEAPHYDLEDPRSVENWAERRKAPGLWADLAGEHVIFTLPSTSVRELEDPSEGLRAWDDVLKAHHELRGTNPSSFRRQRIVPDRQPKAGWMHAGYPIVTQMDVANPDKFILNGARLRKNGSWGMFHEMGHNMQRKPWTFDGTGEVTCNIFTLHAMDVVAKKDPWHHPWVRNKWPSIEQFLKDGAPHDVWKKKAGIALAVYAQLAHHFGWEPYKKVFRQYEKDPKKKEPQNNKERIILWIVRFSKEVNCNLVPLFDFWGLPHIEEAQAEVSGLEPFLPEDDVTALAPERLAEIREKYNMQA